MEFRIDIARALAKTSPTRYRAGLRSVRNEAIAWAVEEQGAFTELRLRGRPGLNMKSGSLSRSLVPIRVETEFSTRAGFMFLPEIDGKPTYAALHEQGGDVRAKSGKLLAWPVEDGPAMTQGGRNRYGNSPRNYPGKLFFFKAHSGQMFLAESFGKGGNRLRLVYHLAKSVTIPARLGFVSYAREALDRAMVRLEAAKAKAWRPT